MNITTRRRITKFTPEDDVAWIVLLLGPAYGVIRLANFIRRNNFPFSKLFTSSELVKTIRKANQ